MIRQLPPVLVNRIAAGEVVERPASAVKELVENAIDAEATHIEIALIAGGASLIAVSDDGLGMSRDELALALERHCTSKLPDDDLQHITYLGFRGEALPSIAAVSRLTVTSRKRGAGAAWSLAVEGGAKREAVPAPLPVGTRVEVRDLFYATPARLKFLKSARAEREQAVDAVTRLAMAYPALSFLVTADDNRVL
ncbi:MAG: DNA mismatch repair endonuclease MutL, partial [Stellaceae bacterium]